MLDLLYFVLSDIYINEQGMNLLRDSLCKGLFLFYISPYLVILK
jgi:hypothetical protein